MIEKSMLIDELMGCWALWCGTDKEAAELARVADVIVREKLPIVSVVPSVVPIIWPWLEMVDVNIFARFYLPARKVDEIAVSDVVQKINAAFKQGANGAQVFLSVSDLKKFVDFMYVIRDDLFFDKDFSIGFDLNDVGPFDWNEVYEDARKLNVNSLFFAFTKDMRNKSDFVGRIYAMLNAWNNDNKFELHFALGADSMRIEQVVRLVEAIQPQLRDRLKFFVNF